jgi:tetratricopeptide (TPR) repeat protein
MEEAMHIVKNEYETTTYKKVNEIGIDSSTQDNENWFYSMYNEDFTTFYHPGSISAWKNAIKRQVNKKIGKRKYARRIAYTNMRKNKTGRSILPSIISGNLSKQPHTPIEDRGTGMNILKYDSTNPFVWNEKGNIHCKKQAYEDAIVSYKRAIEIDPTYGQPYNNLALIYFMQGNFNESILLYKVGIELLTTNQEKSIAWNGLGNAYRCIKDYESARVAYQNAAEFDRENGGVYDNIINFEVSEKHKTAGFWRDLGKLFFKTGIYDKAVSAFLNSIRLEPSSGHSYGYLGRALAAQGQYKEAISSYHKCIDLISDDKEKANISNKLGDVHRKLNDYDNALKAYQFATALTKNKDSLLSRTRLSLLSNCATH